MKNGMDISGKALTAFIMRVGSMLKSTLLAINPATALVPRAKASGMPSRPMTMNTVMISRLIPRTPGRYAPGCRACR